MERGIEGVVLDAASLERLIAAVEEAYGWVASPQGRLSTRPGSVHYHVRSPRRDERGTLEVTLDPALPDPLRIKVAANRRSTGRSVRPRTLSRLSAVGRMHLMTPLYEPAPRASNGPALLWRASSCPSPNSASGAVTVRYSVPVPRIPSPDRIA